MRLRKWHRLCSEKIEDLEDYYLAEKAYGDYLASGKKTYTFDEVKQEYELSHKPD